MRHARPTSFVAATLAVVLALAPSALAQPRGTSIASRPLGASRATPLAVRTTRSSAAQAASASRVGYLSRPTTGATLDASRRTAYMRIMTQGSLNVSRTRVLGRRFMAPDSVSDRDIPQMAEQNFRDAASLMLEHASTLPLNQETATELNRVLTRGLVPENVRGNASFRRDPAPFYRWLASDEARALGEQDPVALAERVHHEIATLDAFPDGNGRTSRLMADLVLVQHGLAPALYTSMDDYFARGAPRAPATRETQVPYFREIVRRGQQAAARAARPVATPSPAGGTGALRHLQH